MPFKYKIIHEKEITFVQAVGEITLESSIQAMEDVLADKEYSLDYQAVLDLSKTNFNPSMTEVFTLRDSIALLRDHIKKEIIVIVKKELAPPISMVAFLAKVYNVNMRAVDHYPNLEELESYL